MRQRPGSRDGCDNLPDSVTPGRFIRRSLLREAVFGPHGNAQHGPLDRDPVARTSITGTVVEVRSYSINLRTAAGDKRLILSPRTVAWRGSVVPPARLRAGDLVIVRHFPGRNVAERIWAQIGRVTGTIVRTYGSELLVDEGPTGRGRQIVRIEAGCFRQIQMRFPRLEAGFSHRCNRHAAGGIPAGIQARHRAAALPRRPPPGGAADQRSFARAGWRNGSVARTRRGDTRLARARLPRARPRDQLRTC